MNEAAKEIVFGLLGAFIVGFLCGGALSLSILALIVRVNRTPEGWDLTYKFPWSKWGKTPTSESPFVSQDGERWEPEDPEETPEVTKVRDGIERER